jgi:hypothetical protein
MDDEIISHDDKRYIKQIDHDMENTIHNMLVRAMDNDNLVVMKYIINMSKIQCNNTVRLKSDIHFSNDLLFRKACMNGNISMVKYLISISEKYTDKKIDIHYLQDNAFVMAVRYIHIDKRKGYNMIKYLIEMAEEYSGKKIDIHSDKNSVLWSCYKCNEFFTLQYLTKICVKYSGKMLPLIKNINTIYNYINHNITFTQCDKYFYSAGLYNANNHRRLIIL